MKYPYAVAILAAFAVAPLPKVGSRLTGKVVKVADGDTLTLRVDGDDYVIRLAGIDAPEDGQDYSKVSRQTLRTTAKSRSREHGEAEGGVPGDFVGAASEGEVVRAAGAEDSGGGGVRGIVVRVIELTRAQYEWILHLNMVEARSCSIP